MDWYQAKVDESIAKRDDFRFVQQKAPELIHDLFLVMESIISELKPKMAGLSIEDEGTSIVVTLYPAAVGTKNLASFAENTERILSVSLSPDRQRILAVGTDLNDDFHLSRNGQYINIMGPASEVLTHENLSQSILGPFLFPPGKPWDGITV